MAVAAFGNSLSHVEAIGVLVLLNHSIIHSLSLRTALHHAYFVTICCAQDTGFRWRAGRERQTTVRLCCPHPYHTLSFGFRFVWFLVCICDYGSGFLLVCYSGTLVCPAMLRRCADRDWHRPRSTRPFCTRFLVHFM